MIKNKILLDIIIDRRKKISEIDQVYNQLKNQISQQKYSDNFVFPKQALIARELNLLESDINEILTRLEQDGCLVYEDKKYKVRPLRLIDNYYEEIIPLGKAIEISGFQSRFETLDQELCYTLPECFKHIEIKNIPFFYNIKRIFYADDKPMFHLEMFYNGNVFDGNKNIDLKDMKIYEYLKKEKNIVISKSTRHIEIVNDEPQINSILNNPDGSATTRFNAISYDQFENPVEFVVAHTNVNYTIHTKATINESLIK
jgi:DNA-binding GntR family transcriptional regulator